MPDSQQIPPRPGWLRVILSVLASAVGVQTRANMERDARARSPLRYIVAGLIGTALFIFTIVTIVRLVLGSAG
jgi:hypothetical protein